MIITLDFETYFDDEYSLKKMTTEEYVRDPRFKCHGVAVKWAHEPAYWHDSDFLSSDTVRQIFSQAAILCHHAQFDGLILSHHFGIRPALWLDTLSMARIALPHERHSLDNLSKLFGLPGKQHASLTNVKGIRDPNAQMLAGLGTMACDDADKTYAIFQQIKDSIPREEFRVIDATIRMFTEPVLHLDEPKMRVYYSKVRAEKETALTELGVTADELQSATKFVNILESLGVEVEQKAGKNGPIPAIAKTDQFMRDLLDDPDERIASLAAARLGVRSTINETRCARLLSMGSRGPLCVYLRYAGAHPTRWSGGDSLNWQNFPRNERDGSSGQVRGSLLAAPGYNLVVADESQVECRILNWLAGQWDVVERFRTGADPYVGIASQFYGEQVYKPKKDDPRCAEMEKMRGTGKQLELSCGYGAAGPSIVETAKRGTYGPPVYLSPEDGERAKQLYRNTHRAVTKLWWETAEQALKVLEARGTMQWGPMAVDDGVIWLPNGLPLWYDKFKREGSSIKGTEELWCWIRGKWRRMWGSKLVQHVCEALARTVISDAMLRIEDETGHKPICTVHDELWWHVPVDEAPAMYDIVLRELKRTPDWAPNLPLDAEGFYGERYVK